MPAVDPFLSSDAAKPAGQFVARLGEKGFGKGMAVLVAGRQKELYRFHLEKDARRPGLAPLAPGQAGRTPYTFMIEIERVLR